MEKKYLYKNYSKGQIIFKEGVSGDKVYIVKSGKVEISKKINDKKVVLEDIGKGGVFGEMALFVKGNKRSASAIAMEFSELIEISNGELRDMLDTCPKVVDVLLHSIVKRLKDTTTRVYSDTVDKPFISICTIISLIAEAKAMKEGDSKRTLSVVLRQDEVYAAINNILSISKDEVDFLLKKAVFLRLIDLTPNNMIIVNDREKLVLSSKAAFREFEDMFRFRQGSIYIDLHELAKEIDFGIEGLKERLFELPADAIAVNRDHIAEWLVGTRRREL